MDVSLLSMKEKNNTQMNKSGKVKSCILNLLNLDAEKIRAKAKKTKSIKIPDLDPEWATLITMEEAEKRRMKIALQ